MQRPRRIIHVSGTPVGPCLIGTLIFWLIAPASLGCATAPPPRPVAEEAAERERARCGPGVNEEALAPVFAAETVEAAEPLYAAAASGGAGAGGNYSRLIGASIRLRAVRGFTAAWLDRALECHSARRVLERIPTTTLPNDPFWLPGRMVDIEVAATRAGFQVFVRGQTIKDSEEILARANAFVEVMVRR
jgi:hypothetical protein